MPGTTEGVAKRRDRCPTCGAWHQPGTPHARPGPKARPLSELIERGRVVEANGCHSFNGKHRPYPTVGKQPTQRIIRVLLGLTPGDGMQARHTCDNPWCINPEHLIVGTSRENHADMVERGRSNTGERHWNWQGGVSKRWQRKQ